MRGSRSAILYHQKSRRNPCCRAYISLYQGANKLLYHYFICTVKLSYPVTGHGGNPRSSPHRRVPMAGLRPHDIPGSLQASPSSPRRRTLPGWAQSRRSSQRVYASSSSTGPACRRGNPRRRRVDRRRPAGEGRAPQEGVRRSRRAVRAPCHRGLCCRRRRRVRGGRVLEVARPDHPRLRSKLDLANR